MYGSITQVYSITTIFEGRFSMRLERSSCTIYFMVMLGCIVLLSFGCSKKEAPPEEIATSEAVVAAPEPVVEEAAPEEVVAAVEEPVVEEAVVEEAVVEETAPVASSSHRVKKGECLWLISEYSEVYNDPFQWPIIYKANMDQIKDPDLIYPDQKFDIPRNLTEAEVASAIHKAKTRGPWSLWDGK